VGGDRLVASLPWTRPLPRALWPIAAWFFGARAPAHRTALYRLLAQAPMPFVQWGLSAILRWTPGSARGHFINVTHAEQVNGCVRRAIEDE
jgi:hypothetical protein